MKHQYLTVLSPKAVACQVEGIALCLGPSAVARTLTLNAAECLKLSFAAVAGDQVVFQDDDDPAECFRLWRRHWLHPHPVVASLQPLQLPALS